MDAANTIQQARANWITPFAFEPSNGGLGLLFSASGTSTRAALVGSGNAVMIDVGSVDVHLAWGGSDVVATTAYTRLKANTVQTLTVPELVNGVAPTHVAVITAGSSGTVQITRGNGA